MTNRNHLCAPRGPVVLGALEYWRELIMITSSGDRLRLGSATVFLRRTHHDYDSAPSPSS